MHPDLFILDDLEHDEHVRNPLQREKLNEWLNKAVLKARGLGAKADYLVIGTVLHFDSVLARLLDPRRSPSWRGRLYQAVVSWSERPDLWDEWQKHYIDWHKADEQRLRDAEAFLPASRGDASRHRGTVAGSGVLL